MPLVTAHVGNWKLFIVDNSAPTGPIAKEAPRVYPEPHSYNIAVAPCLPRARSVQLVARRAAQGI